MVINVIIKNNSTIIYDYELDSHLTINTMEDKMNMQELIDSLDLSQRVVDYLRDNGYQSYNTLKVKKDYEIKIIFGNGLGNRSLILNKKGKIKFSLFEDNSTVNEFQAGNILNLDTVNFLEKYKYTELDARKKEPTINQR